MSGKKPLDVEASDSLDDWIDKACEANPLPDFVEEPEPARGPPLSREDIAAARINLSQWQEPSKFVSTALGLCDRCNSEDFFNRPHLKFLHDAYILAEFVRLLRVDKVRLGAPAEQWPDGQVRVDGKTHNIEATSAHGDRKLGEEYRGVKEPKLDPVENWIARAESIPRCLDETIHAKVEKNYGSPCWLIVYLNINEYDIRQAEIERVIEAIKARHAASFENIGVLWKQKLY